MAKRITYSEGDCFYLPLRNGGYARGVVARLDGSGIVFGYFFGPLIEHKSELVIDETINPCNAILLGQFGDVGLLDGQWGILGRIDNWSRETWPVPEFLRYDEGDSTAFLSCYNDSLEFCGERQVRVSDIELSTYPMDAVMGYGSVEIKLTKLLSVSI